MPTVVAATKAAQSEVVSGKVVDPRIEIREPASDQIEVDVMQVPSAGRRSIGDRRLPVLAHANHARTKEKQSGERHAV
jgi:hypothetical protein